MAIIRNISDKPLKNPLREKLEMMDRKRWERVKAKYQNKLKEENEKQHTLKNRLPK